MDSSLSFRKSGLLARRTPTRVRCLLPRKRMRRGWRWPVLAPGRVSMERSSLPFSGRMARIARSAPTTPTWDAVHVHGSVPGPPFRFYEQRIVCRPGTFKMTDHLSPGVSSACPACLAALTCGGCPLCSLIGDSIYYIVLDSIPYRKNN